MKTNQKSLDRSLVRAVLVLGLMVPALLGSHPGRAADYFVAPIGSNATGNGSSARPWQTLDYAAAHVAADAGNTIRLTAGTHDLAAIAAIPSGVNVIGAGKEKTRINCRYFFDFERTKKKKAADWLPDDWDYDPSSEKSAIIQVNGSHQVLKGFTLDGQDKKCIVGILVPKGDWLSFVDIRFTHFKISGLWMHETTHVEVKGCTFRDNSWGNKNQAFGALQFLRADHLAIHDCVISERGSGCYGIKMMGKKVGGGMYSDSAPWTEHTVNDDIRIYNNRIEVDENGTWGTGSGVAPAIAIEFGADIEGKNVDIHHNWFNNHLSIVSWELGVRSGYRIHHNYFDLRSGDKKGERYSYMIEANESHFEIDHNIVLGGYYPIASWHDEKNRNVDFRIHHNVFYGPAGRNVRDGLPIFRDGSGHDGYQFVNNTIIDTRGSSPFFYVGNKKRANVNTLFKNNLFVSTFGDRGDVLGNENALGGTDISHNLFFNLAPRGNNPILGDPLLNLSTLAFTLQKGSPAIGAGVAIPGITEPGVARPDLGAFTFGRPAWKAGIPLPEAVARSERKESRNKKWSR